MDVKRGKSLARTQGTDRKPAGQTRTLLRQGFGGQADTDNSAHACDQTLAENTLEDNVGNAGAHAAHREKRERGYTVTGGQDLRQGFVGKNRRGGPEALMRAGSPRFETIHAVF